MIEARGGNETILIVTAVTLAPLLAGIELDSVRRIMTLAARPGLVAHWERSLRRRDFGSHAGERLQFAMTGHAGGGAPAAAPATASSDSASVSKSATGTGEKKPAMALPLLDHEVWLAGRG